MQFQATYTSMQRDMEVKPKKLMKFQVKQQVVKAETWGQHDEYIHMQQNLKKAKNEETQELRFKYLITENFIPLEENKIINLLFLDYEEKQQKFQPVVPGGFNNS